MKTSAILIFVAWNYVSFVASSNLDPELSISLKSSTPSDVWDIVVEMEGGVNSVIDGATSTLAYSTLTREQKASLLSEQLIAHAQQAQKNVLGVILNSSSTPLNAKSSWISNSVFIRGANEELIQSLTNAKGVALVRKQIHIQLEAEVVPSPIQAQNGWNIEKIGAPELWRNNVRGEGVILGHIDSGVSYNHTTLRSSWVGESGGWHDPEDLSPFPYESDLRSSHGTHTLATAVGSGGIGVAPGAKWTSCRGCFGTGCSEDELVACGEFMACPRKDSQSKCVGIPNVVTNSWGGAQSFRNFYDGVIRVWRSVGIIPVFAAGNSGPYCGSVNQPCNNKDVICVGAVTQQDELAEFSSVGPSIRGDPGVFKPEIVAPGVAIRSATAHNDTSYGSLSGTSMATPHLAGAVALLLSADPSLNFSSVTKALFDNAWRQGLVPVPGVPSCDPVSGQWPNQKFGYGRLQLGNITMPDPIPTTTPSSGIRWQTSSLLTTVTMGYLTVFHL